jgi:hypothetical protein
MSGSSYFALLRESAILGNKKRRRRSALRRDRSHDGRRGDVIFDNLCRRARQRDLLQHGCGARSVANRRHHRKSADLGKLREEAEEKVVFDVESPPLGGPLLSAIAASDSEATARFLNTRRILAGQYDPTHLDLG